SVNRGFITKFHNANWGVGLYRRNSNLIPKKKFSGLEILPITTTYGKQFKSYLRMRYFLTKHLIQHILRQPVGAVVIGQRQKNGPIRDDLIKVLFNIL
ncbi:hypothetical protein LDENG_00235830, partial [Lucifuga dentata]